MSHVYDILDIVESQVFNILNIAETHGFVVNGSAEPQACVCPGQHCHYWMTLSHKYALSWTAMSQLFVLSSDSAVSRVCVAPGQRKVTSLWCPGKIWATSLFSLLYIVLDSAESTSVLSWTALGHSWTKLDSKSVWSWPALSKIVCLGQRWVTSL